MAINKRAFGSDIPWSIKNKLRARQLLARQSDFAEEVEDVFYASAEDAAANLKSKMSPNDPRVVGTNFSNFKTEKGALADLGSRTPFARMWTAVAVKDGMISKARPKKVADNDLYKGEIKDKRIYVVNNHVIDTLPKNKYKYGGDTGVDSTVVNQNFYGFTSDSWYSEANMSVNFSDFSDIMPFSEHQGTGGQGSNRMPATDEAHMNDFMRPAAGITTISQDVEHPLGLYKRTTVNFSVHNFSDFENIYQRFFLRPGAEIFVDFGWDTADLYNPMDVVNAALNSTLPEEMEGLTNDESDLRYKQGQAGMLDAIMFGESQSNNKDGFVTRSWGDMESVHGFVVDYTAKMTDTGGWECSVEILSANSALLSQEVIANQLRDRIKNDLKNKLKYEGALISGWKEAVDFQLDFKQNRDKYTEDQVGLMEKQGNLVHSINNMFKNIEKENMNTNLPSMNPPGVAKKTYEINEETGAIEKITYEEPNLNMLHTGIFTAGDNFYVCFGLIEDVFLNKEFGFSGETQDNQDNLGNNMLEFNSSESFTPYNRYFVHKQVQTAQASSGHEQGLNILYPQSWHDTYNTIKGLVPNRSKHYVDGNTTYESGDENLTKFDRESKFPRIPLREVYINFKIIEKAAEANTFNVITVLKAICKAVNEETEGVTNWAVGSYGDNNVAIIDSNAPAAASQAFGAEDTFFQDLFMFELHSDNSIVKSADISFTMPEGDYGNYMALKETSTVGKSMPLTSVADKALATHALEDLTREALEDIERFNIQYIPGVGNYQADKMRQDYARTSIYGTGPGSDYLFESSDTSTGILWNYDYKDEGGSEQEDPNEDAFWSGDVVRTEDGFNEWAENKSAEDAQLYIQAIQQKRSENFTKLSWTNARASNNVKAKLDFFSKKCPTLMPIRITLTTYGISSLVNGDLFRVDYLPSHYLRRVYFQVVKVSHEVGQGGWFTTLEGQFRLLPKEKAYRFFGGMNWTNASPEAKVEQDAAEGEGTDSDDDVNDEAIVDIDDPFGNPEGVVLPPDGHDGLNITYDYICNKMPGREGGRKLQDNTLHKDACEHWLKGAMDIRELAINADPDNPAEQILAAFQFTTTTANKGMVPWKHNLLHSGIDAFDGDDSDKITVVEVCGAIDHPGWLSTWECMWTDPGAEKKKTWMANDIKSGGIGFDTENVSHGVTHCFNQKNQASDGTKFHFCPKVGHKDRGKLDQRDDPFYPSGYMWVGDGSGTKSPPWSHYLGSWPTDTGFDSPCLSRSAEVQVKHGPYHGKLHPMSPTGAAASGEFDLMGITVGNCAQKGQTMANTGWGPGEVWRIVFYKSTGCGVKKGTYFALLPGYESNENLTPEDGHGALDHYWDADGNNIPISGMPITEGVSILDFDFAPRALKIYTYQSAACWMDSCKGDWAHGQLPYKPLKCSYADIYGY